jgi:hypothetical protein
MFGKKKWPFASVVVDTSGLPEAVAQVSHWTFDANAATAAFGTYTTAFGTGSTPFGDVT